ncbi:MAG: YihY/virulence factor BrkB family protein [bacterium]|nr:YihY/virulence factor BrkB family protein [bacterium]
MAITRIFGIDWKRFFLGLYDKSIETDIFSRAAQVAFYFSFSLFPLLFFLISLFAIVLDSTEGLKAELFTYIRQIMPSSAFELVRKTLDEIIESSTGGKLTIGLAITLWSASAGIDSLRSALNAVYELRETRWWWKTKLQSLSITLLLILLVAIVLGIVFYGWQASQAALGYLGFQVTSPLVLVSIQWLSILIAMLFTCEIIYNLLPNFERYRWDWVTPGSIVAILLWLLLTRGFGLYLEYFNSYNKAYGSLGAVMILMLWLYLTAIVIVIGGTINAVLRAMQDRREVEDALLMAEGMVADPEEMIH